jgi:hypothetical protein
MESNYKYNFISMDIETIRSMPSDHPRYKELPNRFVSAYILDSTQPGMKLRFMAYYDMILIKSLSLF